MKKIILLLLASILLVNIHSQIVVDSPASFSTDESCAKADYAFEGVIIKQSYYWRNKQPIEADIVRVTRIYKGNLIQGTVEIINYTNDALSTKRVTFSPDLTNDHKLDTLGTYGIFFCKIAKDFPYDATFNIDVTANKVLLSDYSNETFAGALDRTFWNGSGYFGALGEFQSKAAVYKELRKYPNLKIPKKVEQDWVIPMDPSIKPAAFGHHYTEHESDSLARVRNPEFFDSEGKFTGHRHRIKKAKNDSIQNASDPVKQDQ